MNKSYLITNEELKEIGYFFLDQNEEIKVLQTINDRFATEIGIEMKKRLSSEEFKKIVGLKAHYIQEYLETMIPQYDEIIDLKRKEILNNLKKSRKSLLANGITEANLDYKEENRH